MAKQPYIPFYIGDYIKDTRRLPLSVRGAWVDLLLFMWDEPTRGEITASMDEFAALLSCSKDECEFVVNLLIEKRVCDHEKIAGGQIKIISRRMKKDSEISLKRSFSGKKSAEARSLLQQNLNKPSANQSTKNEQIPEYDNEYDNEIKTSSLEGAGNLSSHNLKTKLSSTALEAAEQNQFVHTKKKNTEFLKSQWLVFLHERMNDPPGMRKNEGELNRYFLNWVRNKFPQKNGSANIKSGGKPIAEIQPEGGFGNLQSH